MPYATSEEMVRAFTDAHRRMGLAQRGSSWQCPCTQNHTNGDRTPSMSPPKPGKDGTGMMVACNSIGCSWREIITAVGEDPDDYLPDRDAGNTDYIYTDKDGQPTGLVRRTPDKKFLQARRGTGPKNKGLPDGWEWGKPSPLYLYRLPEVVRSVDAGEPVYLCEGEKDADNMVAAYGVCATTMPMGAGKWRQVAAHAREVLAGAEVVVLQDLDENHAGQDHAQEVAASLTGHAASVKILSPAEGKDASDHIGKGLTLGAFSEAATGPLSASNLNGTAPKVDAPPNTEFLDASKVRPQYVLPWWEGFIPLGGSVLLAANGGMGKSTLACELAAMVTRGDAPPGGPGFDRPRGAVIAGTEESVEMVLVPRLMQAGADLSRIRILRTGTDGFLLPRDHGLLAAAMEQVDAGMIYIDTGQDVLEGQSVATQDVGALFASVNSLMERHNAFALVLHHLNKDNTAATWEGRITGIAAWKNKPRANLGLGQPEGLDPAGNPERMLVTGIKSNLMPGLRGVRMRLVGRPMDGAPAGALAPAGMELGEVIEGVDPNEMLRLERERLQQAGSKVHAKALAAIRELLEARGPMRRTDVEAVLLADDHTSNAIKEALKAKGIVSAQVAGGGGVGWVKLEGTDWPEFRDCPGGECNGRITPLENLCPKCKAQG